MCAPIAAVAAGAQTLIPLALGAISGVSTLGQIQQGNLQAAAEMEAANRAAALDYAALLERSRQLSQSADLESFERARQALRERAKITVAAGEANVGGRSLLRELSNSLFQESYDIGIHRANLRARQAQTALQAQGVYATNQSRINAASSRMVNPFMSSLMIAGNVASGYFGAPRIGG